MPLVPLMASICPCPAACSVKYSGYMLPATPTIMRVRMTQSRNWVRPTRARPMILPIMSWKGLTDDTMTSTMRLVFSSITPRITCEPNMKMKK